MPAPDVLGTAAPPRAVASAAPGRPAVAGAAAAGGAGAMICVGGSVAVSGVLAHAPVFTAEAIR
jgi:hypothetical protein